MPCSSHLSTIGYRRACCAPARNSRQNYPRIVNYSTVCWCSARVSVGVLCALGCGGVCNSYRVLSPWRKSGFLRALGLQLVTLRMQEVVWTSSLRHLLLHDRKNADCGICKNTTVRRRQNRRRLEVPVFESFGAITMCGPRKPQFFVSQQRWR